MLMEKATEIVLCCELSEQGLSKSVISRRLGRDRETIRFWLHGVEQMGLKPFLDKNATACKVPRPSRQVDALVKIWIWQIREREHDCCGQKIAYFLEREHGIKLSVPKIYEVLAERYVLRSKWKKNKVRSEAPVATAPRQVIQMDSIDFGGLFARLWGLVRLHRCGCLYARSRRALASSTHSRTRSRFPASLHEAALQPFCDSCANRWWQ